MECVLFNGFDLCMFNMKFSYFNFVKQCTKQIIYIMRKGSSCNKVCFCILSLPMWHLCNVNSSIGASIVAKLLSPTDKLAKLVFSHRTYSPSSLSFIHLHGNIARTLQKQILHFFSLKLFFYLYNRIRSLTFLGNYILDPVLYIHQKQHLLQTKKLFHKISF